MNKYPSTAIVEIGGVKLKCEYWYHAADEIEITKYIAIDRDTIGLDFQSVDVTGMFEDLRYQAENPFKIDRQIESQIAAYRERV